jgi:Ca2+/Na+ antiporter
MIHRLSNLIGAVAAVWLISCGLVYMVSPKRGGEMLRRLAVFLIGALMSTCLLRQVMACVRLGPWLLLLGAASSVAAFLIREARRPRDVRQPGRFLGAERTPVMPRHIDDERL